MILLYRSSQGRDLAGQGTEGSKTMNNARRKALNSIIERLENLQTDLQGILEEEQGAYDALPEGLQASERGEAMETAIDNLEEAVSMFDDLAELIQEAIGE